MNIMTKLFCLLCCLAVALGIAFGVHGACAMSAKQQIKMPNTVPDQMQPRSGKPEDDSLLKKMFSPRKHKYQKKLVSDVEGLADSLAVKTVLIL